MNLPAIEALEQIIFENKALRSAAGLGANNILMLTKELEMAKTEIRNLRRSDTSCRRCFGACDFCLKDAHRCQSDHK